ncbi:MAG TPA: calcium-binding protein [Pirellulaceae bacterium]
MSKFVKRWFGKRTGTHPQKRRSQFKPGLETLEARQLMAADIALVNNSIKINGYDDAFYGETVRLNLVTYGDTNPFNDKVAVSLTSQRGDLNPPAFNLWKSVNGQWQRNVLSVFDQGYAGRDVLINSLPASADVFVYFNGGKGIDEGFGGPGKDYFVGGEGNDGDIFLGGGGDDYLIGGDGPDYLRGDGGNDHISGGTGNDTIEGGLGSDTVFDSGNVNFTLTNTSLTGLGTDSLVGIERGDLSGGAGNNVLDARAFSGPVTLYGQAGHDTLYGGSGADSMYGASGNDTLIGSLGSDRLDGGADIDTVFESANVNFTLTNTHLSGVGFDTLVSIEQVTLNGGASANRLDASQFTVGKVGLYGHGGNDVLIGGSGADYLNGGDLDDILYGGAGNDLLFGGNGHDTLFGDAGNDRLDGGDDLFVDDLWGGTGADTFYCHQFMEGRGTSPFFRKTDKVWDKGSSDTVHYL